MMLHGKIVYHDRLIANSVCSLELCDLHVSHTPPHFGNTKPRNELHATGMIQRLDCVSERKTMSN